MFYVMLEHHPISLPDPHLTRRGTIRLEVSLHKLISHFDYMTW